MSLELSGLSKKCLSNSDYQESLSISSDIISISSDIIVQIVQTKYIQSILNSLSRPTVGSRVNQELTPQQNINIINSGLLYWSTQHRHNYLYLNYMQVLKTGLFRLPSVLFHSSALFRSSPLFSTFRTKSSLLQSQSKRITPLNTNQQKTMQIYESKADLELAEEVVKLSLKQFAVRIHHLLVAKQKSAVFWAHVEQSFLERMVPTTDAVVIRSYAKIIYALSKSKHSKANYQTKIGLVLPFASRQSFTSMVTAASRIAPLSEQFTHIVQKLYYKRKQEFNGRQLVSINYSLANNGRPCDLQLVDSIDRLNCVETITMLRCYDLSNAVNRQLLERVLTKLKALKGEFNVLDMSDFVSIYLKHGFTGSGFEVMAEESYDLLKRNVEEVSLEKIWKHMPLALNQGRVRIKFAEQVIETMLILRKGKNMGEVVWGRVQATFKDIDNIELKLRLEKIY